MKLNRLIMLAVIFCGINIFAQEQNDYSKESGYFDFREILSLKTGELTTEICLEEPILKMVAQMGEAKDKELGNLIEGLKLVKVNEFMAGKKNIQKVDETFESVGKKLQSEKWNRIIKTKQKNHNAYVFVKSNSSGDFDGLLIMAKDKEGKITIVNIIGKIDLTAIGRLSKEFNFPDVGKFKDHQKEEN
jgi:hypothetical protein